MKQNIFKRFDYISFIAVAALVLGLSPITRAQTLEKMDVTDEIIASGGAFTLQKAVTAGGGAKKDGAALVENGTTGQSVAGVRSSGGQFSLAAGFWTPDDFAPTAANAVVGGQVLTANGRGIRNAQIMITFPSGEIRVTQSSAFGYYRFAEIPVGQNYVISISAKRFTFAQSSIIRQVVDDVQDADFIANEEP